MTNTKIQFLLPLLDHKRKEISDIVKDSGIDPDRELRFTYSDSSNFPRVFRKVPLSALDLIEIIDYVIICIFVEYKDAM